MKKTMAFLLAIITLFLLSAPAFATSNSTWDTVTADDKVVIIVPKEERDRQFNEAMDKIIQELEGTAETMDNKERFRYEYLDYEYETLGGYAGNQVPGGYRFPTFRIPEDRACLVVYRFLCRNRTIGYLSV